MKNRIKKCWSKYENALGQMVVILALLILSPILIPIGGILFIGRYYMYIANTVHNKVPKKYYF